MRKDNSDNNAFASDASNWLDSIPDAHRARWIDRHLIARLPGSEPPWRSTGVRIAAGGHYSVFAQGRVHWSARDPALYGGPRFHLWARVVPGGRIVNLTQDTGSFKADVAGEIELGIYMGMWRDEYGTLATGPELYARLQGHLDVLLIAWREDPMQALPSLIRADAAPWFVANEIARLAAPITPPAGWRYLVETGHADIFTEARDASGKRLIKLDSRDDQGIICTPVDRALTPSTRISWRWRVTAQPSVVAEDTVRTHDYISIAAEFDNGRDLTWIWSATLAPEHHFHCPVKAWTARETHFVVRTGTERLGQWCTEERNIYDDVTVAMGPPPGRIVRIWLICVSSFQHGIGRAEFADIALHDAAGHRPVN